MELSPKLIQKNYRNKKLDKFSAINQLISIIENSEDLQARIESINVLAQINANTESIFKLLENLLISDTHEIIRRTAAIVIEKIFLDIALEPLKWVFKHEESLRCLLTVSKILGKIDSIQSKNLLIDRIKRISNEKILENLNFLFDKREIESFSSFELSKIVENYFVIKDLEKKFGQISYRVK
ncbi:MAG: HEAT repeat domain-containing protein, partial [Promethearchaeota archaeon]